MTAWDRFTCAALDFAQHDASILRLKREAKSCEWKEKPQAGETLGSGPCDLHDSALERCENCQKRVDNMPAYKSALKSRQLAKHRMAKWYPQVREHA